MVYKIIAANTVAICNATDAATDAAAAAETAQAAYRTLIQSVTTNNANAMIVENATIAAAESFIETAIIAADAAANAAAEAAKAVSMAKYTAHILKKYADDIQAVQSAAYLAIAAAAYPTPTDPEQE